MFNNNNGFKHEFLPYFRAYKDGRVERYFGSDNIPPSIDPPSDTVSSKDVLIDQETGVSARIFIPRATKPNQKLPLLIYYHGGGFLMGSPFCSILGIRLIQPYFARKKVNGDGGVVDKCWVFVCPTTSGFDDVRINPAVELRLSSLACERVLVFVAEKDNLRERGLFYCECLRNCGWGGELEVVETEGEDYVFHLFNPDCEKAVQMMDKLASFLNQDKASSM